MKNKEFKWNDSNVIDFVNWYLKVHNIPDNYELENQEILESFKSNDQPEVWFQTSPKLEEQSSQEIFPISNRTTPINIHDDEQIYKLLELYHKALTQSEKVVFELNCLNKKLFDDNVKLETLLSKDVSEQLQEYNDLIDKHGEISWKIHELACMFHYEKISDNKFRQEVRRLIEEHIKNK